jgi:ferredoxin
MFTLRSRRTAVTALVNGQPILVEPKETLLQAALRSGIDFPYSCRVGGCATCKCRLAEGTVKELTETGYLLSDEELDRDIILACQSVPLSDVRVEVVLPPIASRRSVSGRVIGQDRLTHDITRLRVQLDEPLRYRAGQFADLSIAALGGNSRSYSFATPPRRDAQVSFLVRRVPGGTFSSLVNDQDVVGQVVSRRRLPGRRGRVSAAWWPTRSQASSRQGRTRTCVDLRLWSTPPRRCSRHTASPANTCTPIGSRRGTTPRRLLRWPPQTRVHLSTRRVRRPSQCCTT